MRWPTSTPRSSSTRSRAALRNKAAVLADRFRRDADSLKVIDEAFRPYPDSVPAWGGRGVLLARSGRADRAVEDAEAAVLLDAGPAATYQVAGIYALVSASRPAHRPKAVQLLSAALEQGYGHDLLERDADLDSLRGQPEFNSLVKASRSLRGTAR